MKVIHLGRSDWDGGAARASYRIHSGLKKLNVDSEMFVGKRLTEDPCVFTSPNLSGKVIWALGPRIDRLPLKFFKTENKVLHSLNWFPSEVFSKVMPFIKERRPDLIQLHWIGGGFLRPEVLPRFNLPLVWRLADMWPICGAEHYAWGTHRYERGYTRDNRPKTESGPDFNRWVFERKKNAYSKVKDLTIVCVSEWMKSCVENSILFKNRRIEVIQTGQDLNLFKPFDSNQVRERFLIPKNKKIVLFGSMNATSDPRKGFEYLHKALLSLSKERNDIEVAIFGSNQPKNPPDFGFKVHYLGKFTDELSLAMVYSLADVFIAPSVEENLANTVLEAMACEVPVVAFNIGGMPDPIKHLETGYLAAEKNSVDLAKGIQWACDLSDQKQEVKKAARKMIENNFNVELQASRYLKLYEDVLKYKS